MSTSTNTNRLIHETSPYLRQHAHNPVDWYSWGEEALKRARTEDRPILLSIGYSACHWCHVMEHESFENPAIARTMNESFVNIKVDREERPDLDDIYMNAVQAMTGSGGWPMTVFLTPDLKPFYGGTYFPPDDRSGRPGFPRVLLAVAQYYKEHRSDIEQQGEKLREHLNTIARLKSQSAAINPNLLDEAFRALSGNFDHLHGGFGSQPKFPGSMNLSFCLREYHRTGTQTALEMATLSLRKMATGGIYDQLGGGFHRYSVDARWLVPHFEKMLYDNALLLRTYVEAYQATKDPLFRRVVEETAAYVIREMLQPGGGFYATQDADSEGEEGKFFVWTPDEIAAALGAEKGALVCRYYGVEEGGNFEHGTSILHVPVSLDILAAHLKMDEAKFRRVIEEGRATLFALREQRVKPGRDEKVLTDWNGLMIGSLAQAYSVLGDPAHLDAAERSMRFILDTLYQDGRLLHVYKDGIAKLNGYLDDYAFTVSALLDLYEATFNVEWFRRALELNETMVEQFWDETDGGFFFTSADHEALIVRSKNPYDNAIPSGNSIGALNLLRLAALTRQEEFVQKAERIFVLLNDFMSAAPAGFGQLLCALAFSLERPKEIAIIGSTDAPETQRLLRAIHEQFLPHKVLAWYDPAAGDKEAPGLIPLLADRPQIDGKPTVYVCENFVCRRPVTEVGELATMLSHIPSADT